MSKNIIFLLLFGFLFTNVYSSELCENRLFTISTSNQDGVAVGDLLSQLASECGYSILVKDRAAKDRLSKSIASINVRQLPIDKIFDLLLAENELNYEFDGNLLKISFLMTETFHISYIGTSRIGSSNTDIVLSQNAMLSTDTANGGGGGGGGNAGGGLQGGGGANAAELQGDVHRSLINNSLQQNSGDSISGTKITSVDEFDFWGKIEKEIFEIAFRPGDAHQPKRVFSSNSDGIQEDATNENNAQGHVLIPSTEGQSVIVNKIAGLVTVTGTIKQIERVRKYIKSLEEKMQNQVMIDVNILTVTHTNSNTVGIDWNQLYNLTNVTIPNGVSTSPTGAPLFTLGSNGGGAVFSSGVSLSRIVEFLNSYGKVQSVSNPKVLTLSNQPALISVGSLLRYSQTSSLLTATTGGTSTATNESYPSVFSGVLLDVTPSVQGDYIMLKINPSVTRTKDLSTENQATALKEPPNLSSNQLSSLVRAKDGDRVVLGGLISKSLSNVTNRVPVLGYIPILKYLFSYSGTSEEVVEMVIVITPHIVKRNSDNPSLQDLGYSDSVAELQDKPIDVKTK